MPRNSNYELQGQSVDFLPQLQSALEHALPYVPEDPLQNGDIASQYAGKPDGHVVWFRHVPQENQVSTTISSQYKQLLTQAIQLRDGVTELSPEAESLIESTAEHELMHGAIARRFGNSDTVCHYGVEFFIEENERIKLIPYQFTAGPLKLVHRALSAAAPEDLSDIDKAVITGLGYTEGIEALWVRALNEFPLEEGVEDNLLKELIRAVFARIEIDEHFPDDST